jgi:acyl-ACP thioesterase
MYSLDSKVRYSECDELGNLTPLALINYLQDCTLFHSESIGRGADYMRRQNKAWLIAAWQIEILQLPRFYDDIRVSTWCHTMTHTLASRNFVIDDARGTRLVQADSLWFVYDVARGRATRIEEDQHVYLTDEPPLDMPRTMRKLPIEGVGITTGSVVVGERHLDTNRHVNNAQYLGMATDALAELTAGGAAALRAGISRICVQYRQQARLGDVIVPTVHGDGAARTVVLADETGEAYAVVRLEGTGLAQDVVAR